jgi:amino acid transporter
MPDVHWQPRLRMKESSAADLKRELGVLDLALTQILFIIGMSWVGVAAKLGPSHVVFWLLAALLFYVPSAVVVIYLNRLMPLEGGSISGPSWGLTSSPVSWSRGTCGSAPFC